jgi:DivIVA domain-containing protein
MTCLGCGADSAEATPVCAWCGAEVDGAILAEWVEGREFSTTRLRRGYDREEVDAFADAIRDTFLGVREPSLTPAEVRTKWFSATRLVPGYDEEEVDAFLDEAELRLAAQPSTRAPVSYEPSVAGDHAVGQRVSSGWSAAEVRLVVFWILVVLGFVLFPLLTGWPPGGWSPG